MKVLLVEDNPKMAAGITKMLSHESATVDASATGYEAEEMGASNDYDAIVLDLMLPDRDGIDVCKSLRRRGISTPILMLSALGATSDRVLGLNAGADDYLAKPFECAELCARIRALVRRGQQAEPTSLEYNGLTLDMLRRSARRDGNAIALSAREFALLEFLMRRPDAVLSRTMIGEKVWDMNFEPTSNVVDVYISALRKKVDRDYETPLIHTVVGVGYRFGSAV